MIVMCLNKSPVIIYFFWLFMCNVFFQNELGAKSASYKALKKTSELQKKIGESQWQQNEMYVVLSVLFLLIPIGAFMIQWVLLCACVLQWENPVQVSLLNSAQLMEMEETCVTALLLAAI